MATVLKGLGFVSPVADGGVAHKLDTENTLTSGKLLQLLNNAAEKFAVDFEGSLTAVHDGIFGGLVTIAETLAVTGNVTMLGDLAVTGAGSFVGIASFRATAALRLIAGGFIRWSSTNTGLMEWYTAAGVADTNLYRASANVLKTDDSFVVGGDVEIDGDLNHDGSNVGFYGAAPAAKPTVTGSRGANAALADLLTELASLGLLTDSSTA